MICHKLTGMGVGMLGSHTNSSCMAYFVSLVRIATNVHGNGACHARSSSPSHSSGALIGNRRPSYASQATRANGVRQVAPVYDSFRVKLNGPPAETGDSESDTRSGDRDGRRTCRSCPSCSGASPFLARDHAAFIGGPRRLGRRPHRLGRRASPFQPAAPAPRTEGPAASLGGPVASTDGRSRLGRRGRRSGGCGARADFAATARPRAVWVAQKNPPPPPTPQPRELATAQMQSPCPMCRGPRTRIACKPTTHAWCDSLRCGLRRRIVGQLDRGLRHEEWRRLQP